MDRNSQQQDGTEAPLISLEALTLRLRGELVFRDTGWQIGTDQQWAILGHNGSGKSMLASAIMRRVPIANGQIRYYFDSPTSPRSHFHAGEIVIVAPESHRRLVRKSGYHQARWDSIGSADSPVVADLLTVEGAPRDDAVGLLGIEHLLARKAIHLSSGESRKVLLAQAIMQAPKLLILDDPFGGLDIPSRETLGSAIDGLFADGRMRILLVTAREDEIPSGITHVLRVAAKQVVWQGPRPAALQADTEGRAPDAGSAIGERAALDVPVLIPRAAPDGQLLVEMRDVGVSYGDVRILRGVDWMMRQGENWAILGPNGAGKTTLLSLIMADNPQSYANDIALFGRRRGSGESIWEVKEKIGWVSPELRVFYYPAATCLTVVCSGFFDSVGLYRKCSDDQADVALRWMRALGIAELADHRFGAVSVGEQRLVLLTRSLVKNPLLLVLDEPCQGLDADNRGLILELLDQLCQQLQVNMIFVTHHPDEMPRAITHLLKLEDGRVTEAGAITGSAGASRQN